MSIYSELGIREVINANGKMTILGVSTSSETVAQNTKRALQDFVIIEELIDYTGKVIAKKTAAQDGCPTQGSASAVAISVAACIARDNLNLIERMPDSSGVANEIIIQKGQSINFGGSITQMIRLGGGIPIEVGFSNKVEKFHVEGSITKNTAALFHVISHHAVQKGMQQLEVIIEIGKKYNLPVIVDAAAEEDLEKYIAKGATLVIYSGAKALEGPTSGFICGEKTLINCCKKQYKGIGRAMKVSKESMIGLISALNEYSIENQNAADQKKLVESIAQDLNKVEGLSCVVTQDEAGREIYRCEIKFDINKTKISAFDVNEKLKAQNPAIYLRDYYLNSGILAIDPRPLLFGQGEIIAQSIKNILKQQL